MLFSSEAGVVDFVTLWSESAQAPLTFGILQADWSAGCHFLRDLSTQGSIWSWDNNSNFTFNTEPPGKP